MQVASCRQSYRTQLQDRVQREGLQRAPELERRPLSSVTCRFLHEVPYNTMGNITAVVETTAEDQYHPFTQDACTMEQQ